MENFETGLGTNKARILALVAGLMQAGTTRRTAVAVAALSQGETGYRGNGIRPTAVAQGSAECLGLTVGLETGQFDKALSANPKALSFFLKHKWVAQDKNGQLAPSGGLGVPFPNGTNKIAFEYVLSNGMADLLVLWSLGFTHIFCGGRAGGTTHTDTIDGARAYYLVQTYSDMRDKGLNYLIPIKEGGWLKDTILPPLATGSEKDALPWLTVQAGSAKLASELYKGGPTFPGRVPFSQTILEVDTIVG